MKNLLILFICCYGIMGCVSQKESTIVAVDNVQQSPFALSVNRELLYLSKDQFNPSLFGLKQAFLNQEGDFNKASHLASSPVINSIIKQSFSLLGTPYRYGGQSVKTGFDCSGFVGYLYQKEAGIVLPRSTRQMVQVKAPKVSRAKLKPGDLIFFATGRGRQVSHAGIYIGNQYFIHASNHRKGIRIDSLNNRYWNVSFIEAKRLLN